MKQRIVTFLKLFLYCSHAHCPLPTTLPPSTALYRTEYKVIPKLWQSVKNDVIPCPRGHQTKSTALFGGFSFPL